jgi:hypothetical protein
MGNYGGAPGGETPGTINIPIGGEGGTNMPLPPIGSGVPNGLPGGVPPSDLGNPLANPNTGSSSGNSIMRFLSGLNWGDLLGTLGDVGSVAGTQAQQAANGRVTEADLLSRRDLAQNQQYGIRQSAEMSRGNLDLNRQQFSEQARGNRGRQATVASILANYQPGRTTVPGVPSATVTGGLRVNDGAKAPLNELSRQAFSRLLEGDHFEGGNMVDPPVLSEIPKPSGWETAAGTAGGITQILGALAPLFGGRRPSSTATPGQATQPIRR